jgi:thioredoxin reductase (NADPH)
MADDAIAFPTLTGADMAVMDELGTRRPIAVGEYLYREGDLTYDFMVVVSGAIDVVALNGAEEQIVAQHGPGRFLGELNMLTGMRVFVSARVAEAGEVIVIPRDRLRRLIATSPELGDTILAAFIARRSVLLTGASASNRLIGSRFCPLCLQVREFLARSRIPYEWLDPDSDPAVEALLEEFGIDPDELPVVITSGTVLRRPTPGELAEYLGLTLQSLPDRCFDLVVVGGGPGGLAAAVYGASEGLRTLGVEKFGVGGQAGSSSRIENYLGFPTGISGGDLTQRAVVQAEKFGAHLTAPCEATSLREEAGHLILRLSDGSDVAARAVIVASGARYRRLDVDRLEQFEGNGVFYAATEMERRQCAASPTVVVGGGNSAGQAAMFLSDSGPVTIVIRGDDLGKNMSRYLTDRIGAHPGISVRTGAQITGLVGKPDLGGVEITDAHGKTEIPCAGLFLFIGADPSSGWISGCAALDERGFVLTDRALGPDHLDDRWVALDRLPLPFETSHPGLFAVGDVRSGSTKRVAAAVGEGSACVGAVHQFLSFSD